MGKMLEIADYKHKRNNGKRKRTVHPLKQKVKSIYATLSPGVRYAVVDGNIYENSGFNENMYPQNKDVYVLITDKEDAVRSSTQLRLIYGGLK